MLSSFGLSLERARGGGGGGCGDGVLMSLAKWENMFISQKQERMKRTRNETKRKG